MTRKNLINILKSLGFPIRYHSFKTPPNPPYLVYLAVDTDNTFADNKVYEKYTNYQIELYTNKKDFDTQEKIEEVFDEYDIPWESSEIYIEEEQLYQVIYFVTVQGG